MYLEKLRINYVKDGYTLANASAKICQDIILSKISKSSMNKSVTIKGGVVMHGISNDKRRATRDLDLDFIKYSLENESIKNFINKLNMVDDDITILIEGKIEKLHHQDYNGKRINVKLIDKNGFSISAKLDIGVHKEFDIEQEEYCFHLDAIKDSATLIINSKEQMLVEKLKSLLKFGIRSTRYKDIFDFYYLINNTKLNKDKLLSIVEILILKDSEMRENDINDVVKNLMTILNNKQFQHNLSDARNNWLEIPTEEVIKNVLRYFESLQQVSV